MAIDNEETLTIKYKRIPTHNWAITTYILGVIVVILIIYMLSGKGISGNVISGNEINGQIENFVNTQLIQGGGAEISNVEKESGIYKAIITIEGDAVPVYFTLDGKFITQGRELIPISSATPTNNQVNDNTNLVEVSEDDDPVKGNKNAPVTIIEFSDYQCPFCKRFYDDTYKKIVENYIKTGKVKLVYRDFPLDFHENAQKAAEAAECARDQGGDEVYFKMHDKLFENQQSLDVTSLKKYASELGLDQIKFSLCLDSGTKESEIKKDLEDGVKAGVTGTPTFFINGKEISGAQPYSVFENAIEAGAN